MTVTTTPSTTIFLIGEHPDWCPHCQRRMDRNHTPVDHDADGPIFEATCEVHGVILIQDWADDNSDFTDDTEDDDED